MLQLYWEIGNSILDAQEQKGWGAHIVDNLSNELKNHFPDSTGFSIRNLRIVKHMQVVRYNNTANII
jgi:hypothetical protein